MVFATAFGRVWIPSVVPAVIGCSVSRARAASGTDNHVTDIAGLTQKSVGYEVFGAVGTVADISYFDVNSALGELSRHDYPGSCGSRRTVQPSWATLWRSDSNSVRNRIVVDGQVKAERTSNEVNAFTYCQVKGA